MQLVSFCLYSDEFTDYVYVSSKLLIVPDSNFLLLPVLRARSFIDGTLKRTFYADNLR